MKHRILLLAVAPLALAPLSQAQTWNGTDYTWSPTGDSSFTPTFNSGDSVTFTNTGITNATVGQTAIGLSGAVSINNLTLQTTTARLTSGSVSMASSGFNYLIQSDAGEAITATGNLNVNGGVLIFDRANTAPDGNIVHSFAGGLNFTGANFLNLRSQSSTRAVSLQVGSLGNASAGNTIVFGQMNSAAGTGTSGSTWSVANNTRVTITGSKPGTTTVGPNSVEMVSGGFQFYQPSNAGDFMKLSGNDLLPFVSGDYNAATTSADFTGATSSSVLNATAGVTLAGNATAHAVKLSTGNLSLGNFTLTLTGAALSMNNLTVSSSASGGIQFGATGTSHGFIGTWNASNNGTISANLITTGGITILGGMQELNITGANTGLSGGIYLNGTPVRFDANSANNNVITISSIGQLIVAGNNGATQTTTIGGLSGAGYVSGYTRSTGSSTGTLNLNVTSGTTSSSATLSNGNTGRVLALQKSGNGTQILSGSASYTGATAVNAGTLIVNGNFTNATGAVTVGVDGTLGGATVVSGTLSPGSSNGLLTFADALTLNPGSTTLMEISGSSTRGTDFDGVDVTNALVYGGTLNLNFTNSFGPGNYSFNLFDFGSQSSSFSAVTLTGNYTGSLVNNSGVWSFTDGSNNSWTFTQSTGDLTFAAVPEPGTWVLVAVGLTNLVIFGRRRRA